MSEDARRSPVTGAARGETIICVGGPAAGMEATVPFGQTDLLVPLYADIPATRTEAIQVQLRSLPRYTRRKIFFAGEPPVEFLAIEEMTDREATSELLSGYGQDRR